MDLPEETDVLLVIDMQNDFIDGALGTEEAKAIVPKVAGRIEDFEGLVLFTQDTHEDDYLETQEGKNLPVKHCIRDTQGWEIHPEIAKWVEREETVIEKPTFGSAQLAGMLGMMNSDIQINSVTLVGLCTDICVISNAMLLKAFMPEVPIIVDASCCAGVTPESHRTALQAMKACQIEVLEG
ncbi:MAG: cysteine hydrolase [Hespellia sp.]|nr:cysteine hydrolase [Hespellia sp.]